MSYSNVLVLGMLAVVLVYLVMLYNSLVQVKHGVARAWSNIDVLLKQRHDELPKLVEVCKQYKEFEQSTLQKVIEARSQVQVARQKGDVGALGVAEGQLRFGLGQLFAVAEAYPELRSNEHYMQLQRRISDLENAIADRREFYNESVNINNVRVEQFPEVLIARLFHFKAMKLLEFSKTEKENTDIKKLFS